MRLLGPSHLLIQTGIAGGHTETDNMRPEGRIRKTCCATWLDEQREQWTRGDLSLPLLPSATPPLRPFALRLSGLSKRVFRFHF